MSVSRSKGSAEVNKILLEKEAIQQERADLKLEIAEKTQKIEDLKSELKSCHGQLEKLKAEHGLLLRKLETIEDTYKSEIKGYQEEIDSLNFKIKATEKKLADFGDNISSDNEAFEGDTLEEFGAFGTMERMSQGSMNRGRRQSAIFNSDNMGGQKKGSIFGLSNQGMDVKAQLSDIEANHKLNEFQLHLKESQGHVAQLNREIDELTKQLKEEQKRLEISKKKIEAKDAELEFLRTKILQDNENFTQTMNDLTEELQTKDDQIVKLRKQYKNLVLRGDPKAAQSAAKPGPNGKAPEEKGLMDSWVEYFK